MSIINKQSLRIIIIAIQNLRPVIVRLLRDGEREFAAWACATVEDVDEAAAGFLAGDAGPDDCYDGWESEDGFQDQGADGVDCYDGFLVDCGNGGDEAVAVVPGVEIDSIAGVVFDGYVAFV
jgi:hypothetical protein